MKILMVVLALSSARLSSAFYFSHGRKHHAQTLNTQDASGSIDEMVRLANDDMSEVELSSIFRGVQWMESYRTKPDCFRRAISAMQTKCGGEQEMGEAERVSVAISMTLCELATAKHYSPPMECLQFGEVSSLSVDERSGPACVEALSRSTQFWSSYSGYLREISQLCFAFRRWHDIDLAKSIYRNATLEKISLLSLIKQREASMLEKRTQMDNTLRLMELVADELKEASNIMVDSALASPSQLRLWLKELSEQNVDTMQGIQDALLEEAQRREGDIVLQTQALLETMSQKYQLLSSGLVSRIQDQMSTLDVTVSTRGAAAIATFDTLEQRWASVRKEMLGLEYVLQSVKESALQLASEVDTHTKYTSLQHQTSVQLVDNLDMLSQKIAGLALDVETTVQKLNESASDIVLGWSVSSKFDFWTAAYKLSPMILNVNVNQIERIMGFVYYAFPCLAIAIRLVKVILAVFWIGARTVWCYVARGTESRLTTIPPIRSNGKRRAFRNRNTAVDRVERKKMNSSNPEEFEFARCTSYIGPGSPLFPHQRSYLSRGDSVRGPERCVSLPPISSHSVNLQTNE